MLLLLVCYPIYKEPNLGTVVLIGASMLVFFNIAGAKFRYIMLVALLAVVLLAAKLGVSTVDASVPNHKSYQKERITNWLHPSPEAEMKGNYQISRALVALGSGGVAGRGYCGSVEKYSYLPEATTDTILAVIGEELGLLATWLIVVLFVGLMWRGFQIASLVEDRFSALVAAGITCQFGLQAFINIAVVTGTLPATGMPLPLVSYGGSSLLFSLAGIGLLLNVARGKRRPKVRRLPV